MKLLWLSNFSADTAYAIQSHLLIPRLKALGHDVQVLELTPGRSKPRVVNGIKILPVGKDSLGSDSVLEHFRRGGFHAAVSLVDPWGLQPAIMKQLPWFPFAPIDTSPVSPRNVESLKACARPIALTRAGAQELRIAGFDALYLPHGYDPAIWHPSDRAAARDALGIPQHVFFAAFVGVNDSLPSRKGIGELLFAWQPFRREHEDVLLYLHTDPEGNIPEMGAHGGIDINAMLRTLQLHNDPSIKLVDVFRYRTQSIPSAELARVAAAADVLVLPSKGEGFGVPIIEFAACGTPAIVTNFGSTAELASQMGGQMLRYEPDWGWQNAMTAKALIPAIADALERAYQERGTEAAAARRQAALNGAQAYNIDRVFLEYGIPTFEAIAEMALETLA
jgi:glycosyltransferase involved in cell wall biosynthesis